jgi:ATP-dependent helicase/nuclease subunit A
MQTVPSPDGVVKRYSRPEDATPPAGTAAAAVAAEPIVLPAWLRAKVAKQAPRDGLLRPSDSDENDRRLKTGESDQQRKLALQRGTLVHRLLQSLPDVALERRRDTALRFLARNAIEWSDAERETLAAQLLDLIDDARFAMLFAPGSRAEVAIVGRLARTDGTPVLVSGQIDRLVVAPGEVWIVDYKTNHGAPTALAGAPVAYLRQLALYRAVLAKLYPTGPIRAALLWTETPEMMEISAPALDAALVTVISP